MATLIALGSKSRYKLNCVNHILNKLDFDCLVSPYSVQSEVSDQPNSKQETKVGAINRARSAYTKSNRKQIGMGIEFGYEPYSDSNHMICFSCLYFSNKEILVEHSSSFRLPKDLQLALNKNENISDNIDKILEQINTRSVKLALSTYLFKRKFIYESIEPLLIQLMLKDLFQS